MPVVKKKVDLKNVWTDALNGKLPKDDRVFLKEPKFAYLYAKYIRKKRWDEKDERIFYKDIKCAYLYCVFIEDKPPEHLHNFMLAKNLGKINENDKRWIDEYFSHINKNKR